MRILRRREDAEEEFVFLFWHFFLLICFGGSIRVTLSRFSVTGLYPLNGAEILEWTHQFSVRSAICWCTLNTLYALRARSSLCHKSPALGPNVVGGGGDRNLQTVLSPPTIHSLICTVQLLSASYESSYLYKTRFYHVYALVTTTAANLQFCWIPVMQQDPVSYCCPLLLQCSSHTWLSCIVQ